MRAVTGSQDRMEGHTWHQRQGPQYNHGNFQQQRSTGNQMGTRLQPIIGQPRNTVIRAAPASDMKLTIMGQPRNTGIRAAPAPDME